MVRITHLLINVIVFTKTFIILTKKTKEKGINGTQRRPGRHEVWEISETCETYRRHGKHGRYGIQERHGI